MSSMMFLLQVWFQKYFMRRDDVGFQFCFKGIVMRMYGVVFYIRP